MFKWLSKWLEGWIPEQFSIVESSVPYVKLGIMVLVLMILCAMAWWISRRIMIWAIHLLVSKTRTQWDDILFEKKFFKTLAHIVPALIVQEHAEVILQDFPNIVPIVLSLTDVYIVVIILMAVNAFLNALGDILAGIKTFQDKPIKSYIQLGKIIVFIIGFIIIVALLIGKSPLVILGGFGAATAVLLLLFKDTILGLVASVQMSAIDMVRVGDWISMEKYGADGEVIEINLTTVMVQNWDMTVTIIPSYALISDSFKNWRGMQNSGGRRIKRHLNIRIASIKFLDDELTNKLNSVELIREHIESRHAEIEKYNEEHKVDRSNLVNGRHMTNIGVFREYATRYLSRHSMVNKEMTFMVRHLQPSENGIPIEIYCFSKDKRWPYYEGIMADIFDHLMAVVPYFELSVFESPSGQDFQKLSK